MKISKHLTTVAVASLLILGLAHPGLTVNAPKLNSPARMRFIVSAPSKEVGQLARLSLTLERSGFDVAGINRQAGTIEVITDDAGIAKIRSQGLQGERFEIVKGFLPPALDSRYLNPATIEERLKALNQAYPQSTRLEQIGSSLQGRPIWALLISDTPTANDPNALQKPSIIFDGLHHAREVMTPEIVVDVADTLLKNVQVDKATQNLVHRWQIWLVPMLNVDGSNIVFTSDNMWRKNAHSDQNDIFGVDINRNYGFKWAGCNGSSASKTAQNYHGVNANSEPETQALIGLADKVRPTASLSYHSFSEFVLFPFGCQGDFSGEDVMVEKIAKELAGKLPSDSGGGNYAPGTPWQLLYDVDGSSMDYMHAQYGALAYTFEVNQDFQPDYSLRDPTVAKHRDAWTYFLNRIDQNLLSVSVVDGKTGHASHGVIGVDTIKHVKGEQPFETNSAGRYFKILDPGQYIVSATLADGRSASVTVTMNGAPQEKILTVP